MDISYNYKTPETMKLFARTKHLIAKTKNGENVLRLKAVEAVLLQCNSVDNQYHEKSEVSYSFTPDKSYANMLNVESSKLVFLKTYNTEFDNIIIKFTDQNRILLAVEDKVSLTLLVNK